MPELPEVETVRRGLEPFIVGRKIKEIDPFFGKELVIILNKDLEEK